MAKHQPAKQPSDTTAQPLAPEPEVAAVAEASIEAPAGTEETPTLDVEAPPEALANATITPIDAGPVKLRVLVEGAFGMPDDVIELEGEDLAQAMASGQVDDNPAAVAYAESLK